MLNRGIVVDMADRVLRCPVCNYNLTAITTTKCPECGATLQLRMSSDDLKLGPWVVALLAMAFPLSVVALFSISLVLSFMSLATVGPDRGSRLQVLVLAMLTLGINAYYVIGLLRLIRNRREFWAKPRRKQVRSAVCAILMTPALIVLYVILMLVVWFIRML